MGQYRISPKAQKFEQFHTFLNINIWGYPMELEEGQLTYFWLDRILKVEYDDPVESKINFL